MADSKTSLPTRACELVWLRMPVGLRRISRLLSAILADGSYLTAWPWIAVLAPLLSLLLGVTLGTQHPGEIFANSILAIAVMFAVANFSSALGLWIWVGFVFGDFAHSHFVVRGSTFLEHLGYFWIPLVLVNILLGFLLVFLPLSVKSLRLQTHHDLKLSSTHSRWKEIVLQALIQMVLVWIWTQAVPPLVRPIWVWQELIIPVDHIRPLQHFGWVLALVAGALAAGRVFLEQQAITHSGVVAQSREIQASFARIDAQHFRPVPVAITFPLKAAFSTFILSGLITRWWEAIELIVFFLIFFCLRAALATHLASWRRLTARVPLLMRLVFASLLGFLLSWPILTNMWDKDDSFQPIILSTLLSLLIFTVMTPGYGGRVQAQGEDTR